MSELPEKDISNVVVQSVSELLENLYSFFSASKMSNSSETLDAKDVTESKKASDIADKVFEGTYSILVNTTACTSLLSSRRRPKIAVDNLSPAHADEQVSLTSFPSSRVYGQQVFLDKFGCLSQRNVVKHLSHVMAAFCLPKP